MRQEDVEPLFVPVAVGQDDSVTIDPNSEFILAWKHESWAEGQLNCVLNELEQDPVEVEPFRYFLITMDELAPQDGSKLLDVGCGVGHYAALVDKYYPGIEYTGFDFSEAMIKRAKTGFGANRFFVADFKDVDYGPYDIVLVSALITISPAFKEIVDLISAQTKGAVIWHRVFVTDRPYQVQFAIVETYAGEKGYHFFFNKENLIRYFLQYFKCVKMRIWEDAREEFQIATFLCKHSLD